MPNAGNRGPGRGPGILGIAIAASPTKRIQRSSFSGCWWEGDAFCTYFLFKCSNYDLRPGLTKQGNALAEVDEDAGLIERSRRGVLLRRSFFLLLACVLFGWVA